MDIETTSPPDAADPPRERPASSGSGGVGSTLLVLWWYLLGGLLLTKGLWRHPGSRRITGNPGDTDLYQWWLGWWGHALSTMHNPFFTDAMNLPAGVNLMSNTSMPLPALLLAGLTAAAGPLVTYNVLISLAPVASAATMLFCLRKIGVGHLPAVAGGAVFGFAPAIVQSMFGHLSMALAFLLPVLIWLNVLAWRGTRPRRTGLALGAVAFAQLLIGEEILFQAGLGTLVVLIVAAVSRPSAARAALRVAWRAYAWALVVFVPLAGYPLYTQFLGPLRMSGSPFWVDYYAADLTSFTTPSEQIWYSDAADIAGLPGGVPEHLSYLGLPLLIICLAVVVYRWSDLRVRASGFGLLLFAVLSMGGTLWVNGRVTTRPMPYRLLRDVPLVEGALPSRLGVLTAMFAAVLLALALDAVVSPRRTRRRLAVAFGLVVVVAASLLPKPLPVEAVPDVPRYFTTAGRKLPAGTRALVVPIPTPQRTESLRWQVAAGYSYSAPGGYFIAPGHNHQAIIGAIPGAVEQIFINLEKDGAMPALTPEWTGAINGQLDLWGITTVLLGPSDHHDLQLQLLTQIMGGPPTLVDGVSVWTR